MRKRSSTQRLSSERSSCPLPSGTVSFAVGETQKTVTVNVAGDKLVEPNEGFTVTLSKPSAGTVISNPNASGTIINDDGSKQGGSQASMVTATGSGPTSGQMQFIPFNGGAGTGTVPAPDPGQIVSDTAGTDMLSGPDGSGSLPDLVPEVRTPVDHGAGAPIVGINYGVHQSTGNLAMIDAAQYATPSA